MPYKEMRRGKKVWVGKVMVNGDRRRRVCATRAEAVQWEAGERERLKRISNGPTDTDLLTLCNRYLDYTQPRVTPKTLDEKRTLCRMILTEWGNPLTAAITPEMVSDYLSGQAQVRSNNAANKDRKNLLALFTWGQKILGLPDNPVRAISPLPHQRRMQYTPHQEDVLKVLAATTRTERVILTCYVQTGARRSEIFRLTWDDVNFHNRTITLTTRKTRGGEVRRDALPMSEELYSELKWWFQYKDRPFRDQPFVFVCDHPGPNYGRPFKVRRKFLKGLCGRAGV
ncbi:MAG: tyrosine-type recombinase/integrase, partial [Proteobacteria bacterium]|nr:tyrosine-type recombinase/integrase [Pseudomonadota bacterium]